MAKYLTKKDLTECKCGIVLRMEEMTVARTDTATSFWCPNCEHVLYFFNCPYIPEMVVDLNPGA